jgi:thioester reductase-like protein
MVNTIFITGATGNIGGKVVTRILKDDVSVRLILLVRASSNMEAQRRVEDVVRVLSPEIDLVQARKKIRVICGDITLNGLGLPESVLFSLAGEVTHIIHAAATTKLELPLEDARLVNHIGTKNVMTFARQALEAGTLQRIAYVSTAYVCGKKEGVIYEDEKNPPTQFSNTYQETKWEAEQLILNSLSDLPFVIFRPSIVVGDSQTGVTIAFNVLYTPLKWIQKGMLTILPGSPNTPLDVVPVDFVTDAIHHIFLKTEQCVGKTYHLVAGRAKSTTVGEIVERGLHYFNHTGENEALARIKFLPPGSYESVSPFLSGKERRALQLVKIYEPYICVTRFFDNTHTLETLQGTSISAPILSSYFDNILAYSFATNWGKYTKNAA